jgi:hypothetical protein
VIQRIGADGTLGPTFMVGGDLFPTDSIAWTGSELGVLYAMDDGSGNTTVAFVLARFSATGAPLGTSTIAMGVQTSLDYRTLRWAGDRYLAGWVGMTSTTPTATLEEVSADGVVGATYSIPGYGDAIESLATNATTHMATIGGYASGPYTLVAIDRASGAVTHNTAPAGVDGAPVVARDHDFVAYASPVQTGSGAALQLIDATGLPTEAIPVPQRDRRDLVWTSHGYNVLGAVADQASNTWVIRDVSVAEDGTPIGPVMTRGTVSQGEAFPGTKVISRGNGLLTAWASGGTFNLTARLIQDCDP